MGEERVYEADGFLATTVDGEVFLVDQNTRESFRIGGSGPDFWALLTEGLAFDDIAARVAAETGADPAVVRSDLEEFVAELVEIGALVKTP